MTKPLDIISRTLKDIGALKAGEVPATVKITYRPLYSLSEMGSTNVTALV